MASTDALGPEWQDPLALQLRASTGATARSERAELERQWQQLREARDKGLIGRAETEAALAVVLRVRVAIGTAEELATAERAGDAEATRAAKAKAERQAAKAKEEARKQSVREANALRLQAREQLLGAESGLLDTLRHHFYCVSLYGSLLGADETMTKEERVAAACEYWEEGLVGHVLRRDHSHCGEDAECRQDGYKPRPELNSLARTTFLNLICNTKMRSLIAMCIYNGHTWDCESLSNLCHMYQARETCDPTSGRIYSPSLDPPHQP